MPHESTIRRLPLRTVTTPSGIRIPATANQQTPLPDLSLVEATFRHLNGGAVPAQTVALVMEAMRDSAAVVVSYVDAKGELTARVLWPAAVTLTKENHLTAWCYCTLRRAWKSFRLDRIRSVHPLTTPDDAPDPAAPDARECEVAFTHLERVRERTPASLAA